jgi:cytochrome b pre-mRNA-processing protein 3
MQRIGEAFYGRAQVYRAALAAQGAQPLVEALTRNVYGGTSVAPAASARLAAYIREAVGVLRSQRATDFLTGKLQMPDPQAIVFMEDQGRLAED